MINNNLMTFFIFFYIIMLKSKQIIFVIFSLLLSNGSCFGKRRTHKSKKDEDEICGKKLNDLQNSNITDIDPYCNCNSVGIVQKIPYIQTLPEDTLAEVHFSSACIKCGVCLAIASQINDTLLELHESMDAWLSDAEADFLLRNICDFSFKHYGLREIDGKRFICDHVPGATLVSSSADGLWEKHLRDSCHEYLDEIIPSVLYRYWQQWCQNENENPNLVTILCRNEVGKLRHCRNLADIVTYESSSSKITKNYQAGLKIKVDFGC